MAYATAHTIFPLTVTRPAAFKATHTRKSENFELARIAAIVPVAQPEYQTEMEVTCAIAGGTFKGLAQVAYKAAKDYQAYLKAIQPRRFFRRAASNASRIAIINFRPGYATR